MNIYIHLIFSLLLIFPSFGNTQTIKKISGKILDAEIKKPIQYVTVEIEGKNKGALTNKTGFFTFNIDETFNKDSLSIRIIGYQPKKIAVKEFLKNNKAGHLNNPIYIEPLTYTLPEVVFSSDKECEKVLSGVNTKSNSALIWGVGYQFSVYCQNKQSLKNGVISKVRFYLKNEGKPKTPFRIHIYSVNLIDTTPGIELLHENLIVSADKAKWFEVDVEKYNIPLPKEGIFVSMEWIYTDEKYYYISEPHRKKHSSQQYGQVLGAIEGSKLDNYTYFKKLGGKWNKFIYPPLYEEGKTYNALIGAEITYCP